MFLILPYLVWIKCGNCPVNDILIYLSVNDYLMLLVERFCKGAHAFEIVILLIILLLEIEIYSETALKISSILTIQYL